MLVPFPHKSPRNVRDKLLWRLPPYEDLMPIDVYLITNPAVRPSKAEAAFVEVMKEMIEAAPPE